MKKSGWVEGLTRSLIQHAAHNAPAQLSERLEEEWLADLAERSGQIARLRFAAGCCWATRVIAFEHCAPKVTAGGSITGSKVMTAYAEHDFSLFSRRSGAFVLIVALHVVVISALANGLGHTVYVAIKKPMTGVVIPEIPKHQDPPPLPTPKDFSPTTVDVPRVDLRFDDLIIAPPVPEVPTTTGGFDLQPAGPAAAPKAVNRIIGGPGRGFPNTEDYYPAGAKRLGQQGIAAIHVCVDGKGLLTAAPTLARTSGYGLLDEGALKLAKAGNGRYRATTEDGQGVSSCYEYGVRFSLK
jgi:protein TonB